jgi:lycopene beta-cyclase
MDARVSQEDGLRFVYVLPFDSHRVLIEDTYFSDQSELDDKLLEERIFAYAKDNGFAIQAVARRERGVLPLPLTPPRRQAAEGPLLSGFQGGWFHPTTGYSFPTAVRLAEFIAARPLGALRGPEFERLERELARQQRYFCFLNRLMYGGFPKEERFNVLERFYRLPPDTIRRFYALDTTVGDRARVLCGRPPRGLSISHALSTASTL